ncbi:hypothetical protein AB595_02540 [Massilia sp. WF1]|uniref:DUF1800 domain-containing protein n=1 Tax=unclassified Massilia TaxID=2609279 RepID=UPI00064A8EFA|nr:MULTISPECIES: DUF1800 domain-containing protein [unclassified Massilia]ALK98727.1 hypothetical protein AM586_23515 [Massilia sp. WG5]KLU38725.1 hypothetical protein AB595_02540 [Massilia sp. WF1]
MFSRVSSAILAAALLAPALHAAPLAPGQQAVHVLNRLAFGPRPGDVERVRRMGVQAWIDEQLHPETIPMPPALSARLDALETVRRSAGESLGAYVELRKEVRNEDEGAQQRRRLEMRRVVLEEAEARLVRAVESPRQLEEVMVDFWFNHFNVFAGKGIDRALVASYERDAIRPNALGSFRALLGATAKHPAMLFYLDNVVSSMPRPNAKGRAQGLNENYARELMELHTLGVDGGYTQRDVTELARMLTGWTFDQRRLVRDGETFRFDPRRHDQGAKTWLGHEIAPGGQGEGEHALDVLAMHPATARHVSFQLAQYFVSDAPPPALVEAMTRTWLASQGDIRAVLKTLFASSEFMDSAALGAKFKTPYQFVVSAMRAGSAPLANVTPLVGAMSQLGMPLYGCQTPDGYKNTQDAWLNPDALTRRIAFATALAQGRLPQGSVPLDPALLQATLAGAVSPRTLDTVARQPENLRAAMLLGSPDFMQR